MNLYIPPIYGFWLNHLKTCDWLDYRFDWLKKETRPPLHTTKTPFQSNNPQLFVAILDIVNEDGSSKLMMLHDNGRLKNFQLISNLILFVLNHWNQNHY